MMAPHKTEEAVHANIIPSMRFGSLLSREGAELRNELLEPGLLTRVKSRWFPITPLKVFQMAEIGEVLLCWFGGVHVTFRLLLFEALVTVHSFGNSLPWFQP